ncbi:MAG TPA: competence/damage-inducible protein A [Candidatus Obscuribacter sp.]|nr:competence/damage-inducible protein A [Candidatus Obscuribacter sp.]HNH74257.1 competence/damage-inducible protein A [Candidatus Obscuribacter sp.]
MARAEVLCIGTELLLGDVLDTNSQFLARELALLGIDCFYRVVVGDNPERIKECVRQALGRADIVITSGGLGPTADDLTTECLAGVFNAPMDMDEEVLAFIRELFASRNIKMTESNRKQALRPRGADILPNPVGSAPGIVWQLQKADLDGVGIDSSYVSAFGRDNPYRVILTFPGVPSELKAMWTETAAPYLARYYPAGTIWSTELKHIGIGESALAEKYAHLLDLPNPTVAPYAGRWECRLRVAAKAASQEEARLLAQPVVDEIRQGSGVTLYGEDDDTLEAVVGRLLTGHGKTLSLAESCTGGLITERLTDMPGSSRFLNCAVVAYSNASKVELLGVDAEVLNKYGAVSEEAALAMAQGMLKLSGSDLALSVTGIAGPEGGTEEKPVGLVYVALCAKGAGVEHYTRKLSLGNRVNRSEVRWRTANQALNMVRLYLLEPAALKV